MAKYYTEEEIKKKCENALKTPETFYTKRFINYKGKTESNKKYADIIANYISNKDNVSRLSNIGKRAYKIRNKFYVHTHNGIVENKSGKSLEEINGKGARKEELFAISLFNSETEYCFGKVVEYQIPLKGRKNENINIQEKDKYPVGKIDLIAVSNTDKAIYLVELKKYKSDETLLRCIFEIYTYIKLILNQKKEKKFKKDISKRIANNNIVKYKLIPAIIIFKNSGVDKQSKFNSVVNLAKRLNEDLQKSGAGSIKVFQIDCDKEPKFKAVVKGKIELLEKIPEENIIPLKLW